MKTPSFLLLAAVVILSSCGGSKPDMSQPALTGVRTPVYEGMVSLVQGSQYTWLPPQTVVYVQSDSLKVGDSGFVKVWWNDSSGYVPAGWAILNGKKGVISVDGTSAVFTDAALTNSADATMGDWILVSVGDVSDVSAQIMYADAEGEATYGYIDINEVFFDPLDVSFFEDFNNSNGSVGAYEAIRNSDLYTNCRLARMKFGDSEEGEVNDEPAYEYVERNVNYHQDPTWYRDERQAQLTEAEYPGEFALNYQWYDSTFSEVNHFGDTLSNGYESCVPDYFGQVTKYIMAFTPKEAMDFTLETNQYGESDEPKPLVKQFTNVVPGTKYTLSSTTMGYYNGCQPRTFIVRMKDGRYAEGSIGADCGD